MATRAKTDSSDQQIVLQIRSGSTESFALLVDRYQKKLYYYALKYIHDDQKAQDVIQEAFIKMYVNLNSFDVDRNFSAWAYRIVHNEALNFIKRNRHEVSVGDESWFANIADERVDLAAELDSKNNRQQIRMAVFKLPMKYRDVLVLYYFEGLEYDDIARVLHIPTPTVGTRIRRAKAKLKAELPQELIT